LFVVTLTEKNRTNPSLITDSCLFLQICFLDKKLNCNGLTEIFGPNHTLLSTDGGTCIVSDENSTRMYNNGVESTVIILAVFHSRFDSCQDKLAWLNDIWFVYECLTETNSYCFSIQLSKNLIMRKDDIY